MVRHGTPRKYLNLMQAYTAYLRGSSTIASMPAFLKVEISRYCEVDCLYCPSAKQPMFYPLDKYEALIDRFKDYVFLVSLYDIGEPLHHSRVIESIEYAHQNNVGTVVSSSLSLERSDEFWNALATSGLDRLIVAIDGITPEVYNRYRRNGDLGLVLSNLERIIAFRDSARARLFIEWQMIDFDWNRAEHGKARDMARMMGCNDFRIIPEATRSRIASDNATGIRSRNCLLPYVLFFVTASNAVRLCYKVYHHDMSIGNLDDSSFSDIWTGRGIARVRDRSQIGHRPGCQKCKE